MDEGVFEIHWQRREYGELTIQLYRRDDGGQLAHMNEFVQGPFDTAWDITRWLVRAMVVDGALPAR